MYYLSCLMFIKVMVSWLFGVKHSQIMTINNNVIFNTVFI